MDLWKIGIYKSLLQKKKEHEIKYDEVYDT